MDRQLTTCPSCGASNPAGARWCGQCYEESRPAGERVAGWACRLCGEENSTAVDACATCGSSIFASFGDRTETPPPREALWASLAPGLGLAKVGMSVEGTLVGVLVLFAVGAGLFVTVAGNPGGWVLAAVGAGLWLVSIRDAYVVSARRGDAWLWPRTISLWAGVIIVTAAILVLRTPLEAGP